MFRKILIVGEEGGFNTNLKNCLGDNFKIYLNNNIPSDGFDNFIAKNGIDIVVINKIRDPYAYSKEINIALSYGDMKIILLEQAERIYLNSKNQQPYSVYSKIESENEICLKMIEEEDKVLRCEGSVVFRVSELYGPYTSRGLVRDIIKGGKLFLDSGIRDFIYDGDLINAIEVAIESDAEGVFNIVSGMPSDMVETIGLVKDMWKIDIKVDWIGSKDVTYECENFKFYKWQPLISIETGLGVIKRRLKNK